MQPIHISKVRDVTPSECQWLYLNIAECQDQQGRSFQWEYVTRTTRFRETDGCAVFAKVVRKGQPPCIVLVSQFRPPLNKFVVEAPAGVIDKGETIEEAALRELKEETGYTGRILSVSPEVVGEPGIAVNHINLVTVEVDGDAPENQDATPDLQVGESLQVLLAPLEGLYDHLLALRQQHGWEICSRLLAYALALKQAQQLLA